MIPENIKKLLLSNNRDDVKIGMILLDTLEEKLTEDELSGLFYYHWSPHYIGKELGYMESSTNLPRMLKDPLTDLHLKYPEGIQMSSYRITKK